MKRHDSIIKMTITTENYEFYALDYLEANLDASTQKAMNQFLAQHPEILAEIEEMQSFILLEPDDEIIFEKKESLKREIGLASTQKKRAIFQLWTRYATAAAVVLGLILGTIQLTQNNISSNDIKIVDDEHLPEKKELLNDVIQEEDYKKEEVVKTITKDNSSIQILENNTLKKENSKITNHSIDPTIVATTETKNELNKQDGIGNKPSELPTVDKGVSINNMLELEHKNVSAQAVATVNPNYQIQSRQIDQKNAVIELNLLHEGKILAEILNTPNNKIIKEWKTPFGVIKWGDVAEALRPESYFASK